MEDNVTPAKRFLDDIDVENEGENETGLMKLSLEDKVTPAKRFLDDIDAENEGENETGLMKLSLEDNVTPAKRFLDDIDAENEGENETVLMKLSLEDKVTPAKRFLDKIDAENEGENETGLMKLSLEDEVTHAKRFVDDIDAENEGENETGLMKLSSGTCVPSLPDDQYHAFISHCSDDKQVAEELTNRLEKQNFKCYVADRDFIPGANVFANMKSGITKCSRTIIVASKTFIDSDYFNFEVSEALMHQIEKKQCVVIPLLYNINPEKVPSSLKSVTYIQYNTDGWFEKLLRAITEDRPLTSTIPAGDVAHGLAWSYYYSYLAKILPGLEARVMRSEYWPKKSDDTPILAKFISIMPASCNCPKSLREADRNIETLGKVMYTSDMAGVEERDYSSSVHRVTHPETGKQYLFLGEFATPLNTLHSMEKGGLAGLSSQQRYHQMSLFREKLKEILVHPSLCNTHNKSLLLDYQDVESKTTSVKLHKDNLSTILVNTIEYELLKEKTIKAEIDRYVP